MSLEITLRHRFPGLELDLSFAVPPGVTALFGPSGAGKTTVAQALAGLLRPDQGRICLAGRVLFDRAQGVDVPPHRRRIGTVFQDARLFPHLTVRQNLNFGRWFAPRDARQIAPADVIDLLALRPLLARRPLHLSGGEKSRVALGRALLSAPQMLVMDEPLAALDNALKAEILPYLAGLHDAFAVPILYISHSPAEVTRLADQVVMLERGRIRGIGPVAQMMAFPIGTDLAARVEAAEGDGLTRLRTAGGSLYLPEITAPPGQVVRLWVGADGVVLSLAPPRDSSALNVLSARVRGLEATGGQVLVMLDLQDGDLQDGSPQAGPSPAPLQARVSARAARALDLAPGRPVFAQLTGALQPMRSEA